MILARLRYLQAVGGWHDSAIKNFSGRIGYTNEQIPTGVFYHTATHPGSHGDGGIDYCVSMDISRSVSTASDNRTRTYAVLGCVYVRRT